MQQGIINVLNRIPSTAAFRKNHASRLHRLGGRY